MCLKMDLNKLESYVEQGLLRKAEDTDLVQYNYTEKCNNQSLWDDITRFNRGNIYEKATGKLIAKSFPKFMNFGQLPKDEQDYFLSKDRLTITEKKDGCLGILYLYNNEIRFNSRGGFDNHVTQVIKKLLPKYIMVKTLLKHNVLVVEVISPETKILCDYGDETELYLLTAYSNSDWSELSTKVIDTMSLITHIPRPKHITMTWDELFTWQQNATWETEGFVVAVEDKEDGSFKRVKIKSDEYLKVAKQKACLNKHNLWKYLRDDIETNSQTLKTYIESLPDELYKSAKELETSLLKDLNEERQKVKSLIEKLSIIKMEDLSKYFAQYPTVYKGAIYNDRNNKPYDRLLVKLIEPKEELCKID